MHPTETSATMRTSLAFVSLLLAVSQIQASSNHHGFEDGKTYVYQYNGRIATGIADDVHQFSGMAIRSKLHVQKDGDKIAFQVHDSELGPFNKKIENVNEVVQAEFSRPDSANEYLQKIEQPFWVEYKEGVFEHIYFNDNEDVDKQNVQKAIATLFQLDLPNNDDHFYTKLEDGVTGKCPTYYTIGHYHETDHQILNITKGTDYTHCENRPHLFYSSLEGYKCTECDEEFYKPLRSTGLVTYSLSGNREQYVVEEIHSTGVLAISPFSTNGQTAVSVVNQTLVLEKVEAATPIAKPGNLEKVDTLHYTFHNDERDYKNVDLKAAHYYDRVFEVDRADRMTKANELFAKLQGDLSAHKAYPSGYIPKFVDILVSFDFDDFETFYGKTVLTSKVGSTGKLQSAALILLEILPFLGTNPSILYMMKIVRNKDIDTNIAKKLIMKAPFYVKEPSKALIDAIRTELSTSPLVKENKNIHTVATLAYGNILNRACVEDAFHPHPEDKKHYVDEADCKTYVEEIIKFFEAAQDDAHRTVYLRALVNADTDVAFNYLVSVVKKENPKYHQLVRQVAMTGLFNNEEEDRKQLSYTATVPIYLDHDEDYVIRIYAFEVLLYSSATPENFGHMILTLNNPETPQKLKSYMYAALSALSNTTNPCYEPWKKYARHAIQYVEHYQRDAVKDSVVRHYSMYNAKYNYGKTSTFATVASDDSIFPREIYAAQSMNRLGYNFDLFEMGYSSEGQSFHEDILSNLGVAPRGLTPHLHEVTDDLVKKAIEKFGFKHGMEHEMKPYEFYLRIFNKNVFSTRTLVRDLTQREESEQIYGDGEQLLININKLAYLAAEAIIPNVAGLPVSFKFRLPIAAHIHGSLKFEEKVTEVDGHFKTTGFHVQPDVHLGLDTRVYTHVAVLSPVVGKSGFALKTKASIRYPFKGEIDYDLADKQITIKETQPNHEYDFLYYKTTPYTVLGEDKQVVHYSEHPTNKKYDIGHNYFGVGLTFNFTYDYYWNDYGSYRHFLKSFFKKSSSYEDYWYLSEKWYGGTRNFLEYVALNPTAKPFSFNARYSQADSNPTTEFIYTSKKEYPKNYDFGTNKGTYGLVSKCELVGKGPTERKWEAELDANIAFPYRDHRNIKFHFKRTPLPGYDTEPFEVCFDGKTDITDFRKIYSLQTVDIKAVHEGHWKLGKTCGDGSKQIDVKVVVEKSEEQLSVDKNTIPHYVKCMELSKKGYYFNDYCIKYIMELGRLDKLTADIEHKNIPENVKTFFQHVYFYIRHHFYNNVYIDHHHGSNKPNTLHVVVNASYEHPTVVDVEVQRPDKTFHYNHIYMPSLLPQFEPLNVAERMKDRIARKVFNYHIPMCFVTGKYVRTFDGVSYKAPLGETWHLAFSDSYWNHVFVFYKAVSEGKYTKASKIYLDGSVITFVPKGDKIEITVDGQQVMHDGKNAYIKEGSYILYKYADGYGLESKNYRMMFYFDGVNSVIGASNFYRGKQHGLCGDFDGETHDEFEGPDGTHYEDASDYTHSYSVE